MSKLAKDKLEQIQAQLSPGVGLMAVSKTRPVQMIKELYDLGQVDFGENKVQDLFEKSSRLTDTDIKWHFIGHLQSNKINQLLKVKNLVAIHSIDSLRILKKLLDKNIDRNIGLFLQINTSLETEKSGFESLKEIRDAIELIQKNPKFQIQGLMTIGKIRSDDFLKDAHECFSKLKDLKNQLDKGFELDLELSMGMSSDFEIAQEYGSHWVRIGSALF